MNLQTILFVWATLSGVVFSVPSNAQEIEPQEVTEKAPALKPPPAEKKLTENWTFVEILRGAQVKPHTIPAWFASRATPQREYLIDPESIDFDLPKTSSSMGRPPRMGAQHACQRSNGTWVFCD